MSFRFRFNPFKKLKKAIYKNEPMPGERLAEKILKTDIEKRQDLIQKVARTDEGHDKLANALSWLRDEERKVLSNLSNIKNFYIVQTLIHIYGYDNDAATNWVATADSQHRLVAKLPDLPEVNFSSNTSPHDIAKLKTTFKARVEQVDALNHLIPQIEHAIKLILNVAPNLADREQSEARSAATPY